MSDCPHRWDSDGICLYCNAQRDAPDPLAAAEARAERYRVALETIGAWDCLNPPRADLLADLPWLRAVVDIALRGDA